MNPMPFDPDNPEEIDTNSPEAQDVKDELRAEVARLRKKIPSMPTEVAVEAAKSHCIQVRESMQHIKLLAARKLTNDLVFRGTEPGSEENMECIRKAVDEAQTELLQRITGEVRATLTEASKRLLTEIEIQSSGQPGGDLK